MKVLSPEEFKRFSNYRTKRKEIAETDGVKPFVVMTDAQMAELSKIDNPVKADLRRIDGFGEARIDKYGERLLSGLANPNGEEKTAETHALVREAGSLF